ncbi:MAG: PEP-CTERM sorting domain-containing protein [Pseudomonadota bacterium]
MYKEQKNSAVTKWLAAGMSALCLMSSPVQASPGATASGGGVVWSNSATVYSPYGDFSVNSPSFSPVSYGAPLATSIWSWSGPHAGDANLYASATPAMQTLRAASAVASAAGTENRVWAQGSYQGQLVYVAAGSSGLNVGDAVTLQFSLRVDGTLAAGNGAYPPGTTIVLPSEYGYAASASASMRYSVYDLGVDAEVPTVEFHYDTGAMYGYSKDQYGDVLTDTFSSNGRYTNDRGWNWTDLAGNVQIDNTVSPVPFGVPGVTYSNEHPVDTDHVLITLDTFVGNTLMIDGSLYTEAAGWGDLRMTALSDFGSTFDAEVTPLTVGVELVGLQAGIAPVPEADTWAMMLAGLGLIGFAVGRRRVN